jgi:hypothetical protein
MSSFYIKLTPWSRVLLEKLAGRQLVKKFPAFYGTRRFITALTRARLLYRNKEINMDSSHKLDRTLFSFWCTSGYMVLSTLHTKFYILICDFYAINHMLTYPCFSHVKTQSFSINGVKCFLKVHKRQIYSIPCCSQIFNNTCFDYENISTVLLPSVNPI